MRASGRVIFWLLSAVCSLSRSRTATLGSIRDLDAMLGPQQFRGVANFSTFLLDRSSGILFLGARDAILAVDTNNLTQPPRTIVWDVPEEKRKSCVAKGKTEGDCNNYLRLLEFLGNGWIYACGTYAFDPQCVFLNMSSFSLERGENGVVRMETWKGKCPFEPSQHYTAVMAGGILYTAATSNFLGTLFDISRATGQEQERIRTERSINWLSDPEFVSSVFIQQDEDNNPQGEDNKIYFFFTEVAKEYDLYTKVKVPRVARVCKSDVGGMKTLQKRWTTFLKAQLVCEDRASGQRYNILTDVYTKQHTSGDPSSTHFYGLFTSQWEHEELSAVCVYSLADISKVMDGPFKELKKTCENWINPEPVPTPRPGQCLNSALRAEGFESSLKLPDKVLTFMRDHPLMENNVIAAPLLVRRGITYTKVAVTRTTTESDDDQRNTATVLHLGTDRGELHRVLVVGHITTLLQEIPLFSAQEPVNNILLHKGQALVGTPLSLARVGAEGCSLYPSCEVCARARTLGCVWRAKEGACGPSMTEPIQGQEVEDALKLCASGEGRCSPILRELRVSVGLHVLLPCVQVSTHPCTWEHPPHRHTRQHHSDLEVTVTEESLGTYTCLCQEGGPGGKEESPACRRASYHLTLEGPSAGGAVAMAGGRHLLAIYMLCFILGVALGCFLLYFLSRRRGIGQRHPDHSLSSEKGQDLLGSSATPQSPSSGSLLSEGFPLTEKRGNGTLLLTHHHGNGNGGHHGNYGVAGGNGGCDGNHGNGGGGHGNAGYANNANCNVQMAASAVNGLKLHVQEMVTDERRGGERERRRSEGGQGDEEDEGLGEVLGGLEQELAGFALFKLPAPLAQCEESSI
ncbi:semaphorin-4F-like isoform X2 [Salvelinus fontinalis]|uniref:semaphorin-4F-like isoform X2 n=1 Tax=Salvelinus fontinalis TaxID=8038 RepID=UPI0024858F77|nr:semaphorin-4F-like isoform X2 [Salvelinus fontinalis]